MSEHTLNTMSVNAPAAIHPVVLRTGLFLVIFVAMVAFAARATAQPASGAHERAAVQTHPSNVTAETHLPASTQRAIVLE